MKKHQKNHFWNIALFTRFNLVIIPPAQYTPSDWSSLGDVPRPLVLGGVSQAPPPPPLHTRHTRHIAQHTPARESSPRVVGYIHISEQFRLLVLFVCLFVQLGSSVHLFQF